MSTINVRLADRLVRVDDPVGITHLEALLRSVRVTPDDTGDPFLEVSVRTDDDRYECYLGSDDSPYFNAETPDDFLLLMERTLINLFLRFLPDGALVFHGAGFFRDGYLEGYIGGAGAGKSTLAATLLDRDWTFVTDELIALEPEGLTLHPFPKPLNLESGGAVPAVDTITLKGSGGDEFVYGLPDPDSAMIEARAVESMTLYLLDRRSGVNTDRVRLRKGKKFRALYEHLLRPEDTSEKFKRLAGINPENHEVYRLRYPDVKKLGSMGLLSHG